MTDKFFEITIREKNGIHREHEPLTHGVPFPSGYVYKEKNVSLIEADTGKTVLSALTPLSRWADGSIKWGLLDYQLSMPSFQKKLLKICVESSCPPGKLQNNIEQLKLYNNEAELHVDTGTANFKLDTRRFIPFKQIISDGNAFLKEAGSAVSLIDEKGKGWRPHVAGWQVESFNSLRLVLGFEGEFSDGDNVHGLRYNSRIHFYAGKSVARIDFTLCNPCAACHPGGVWDLGDQGSLLFRGLDFQITVANGTGRQGSYLPEFGKKFIPFEKDVLIYQDSSGGDNWQSRNHLNRNGEIPVSLKGYEIRYRNDVISRGTRATPCIAIPTQNGAVAVTMRHFWQNFPKSLESDGQLIRLGLFPEYFNDLFEIQGGEQKTYTIYIDLGEDVNLSSAWVHSPLIPELHPEWYYKSGACPRPVPLTLGETDDYFSKYQKLIEVAVSGDNSFFKRREIIDEYGWRNFGDIYADHESVFHKEPVEFISHYNNQYDVIKGALVQFMRSGNSEWFRLSDELARHVSDIDIYHTDSDRFEFNNGLFWHTDHHLDAATCTHRSFSRKHRDFKPQHLVGGGPAHSHNYATGFVYHYWMTGDIRSKESAIALADYMVRGVDGSEIILERLFSGAKKSAKWLLQKFRRCGSEFDKVYGLNGPGRASGNALNTLLDGYLITSDLAYVRCAERLICRCISPADDIPSRDLLNAEIRWMYTIFFQALGRYLDLKMEIGETDGAFTYARTCLINYADWMAENEYPYLEKPEILEFPNETWAAQDIRKSEVMAHAAIYAPDNLHQKLIRRSRYFFEICIDQLLGFDTKKYTRPLVLLMCNGMVHAEVFLRWKNGESWSSNKIFSVENNKKDRQIGGAESVYRFIKALRKTTFKKEFGWLKRLLKNRRITREG